VVRTTTDAKATKKINGSNGQREGWVQEEERRIVRYREEGNGIVYIPHA